MEAADGNRPAFSAAFDEQLSDEALLAIDLDAVVASAAAGRAGALAAVSGAHAASATPASNGAPVASAPSADSGEGDVGNGAAGVVIGGAQPSRLISPPQRTPARLLELLQGGSSDDGNSGGLNSGSSGALTAHDDGYGALVVRCGPQVLVVVVQSPIPLPMIAKLDIWSVPVGFMFIFDGPGATMFWKAIDSIFIMRPKVGKPAPGKQYGRYLGNLTPGSLGRRRLEELAASGSEFSLYAAHFLDAVAFVEQYCPFIATGNLGLSVMLQLAAAASHYDKPDCLDTVRGIGARLAEGAAAAAAAAEAARKHVLQYRLHVAQDGYKGLVDGAEVAQIEHVEGTDFMASNASGEATISIVPTDEQRQASVVLQRFERGRAVRVRL